MKTTTEDNRAEQQAKAEIENIVELVARLKAADESDDENERDAAREAIQEDPLSVQVRGGWHNPGEESDPEEFMILLCTGGPAVRIIGELGQYNEPDRARIEYQDWFTPWVPLSVTGKESDALLTYCLQFYFGE